MKKILIIVVLGFLIYGLSLSNGFVWDDEVMFQKAASIPANVYFRPAISTVYSIIYNLFGPQPFFYHLFQLIFHIATTILIYYLFRRFFKETISLILAIIFLVHPANVEAVSFASAMQETAFTLTGITGLYLFVKMDSRLRGNDVYAKVFFATLLLLIALLMKETAIVFFLLVFCYLVLFRRKKQDVLISYSIFAVIFLMVYFLFRLSGGNLYVQGQGLFPIMRVSLATRLINIPMIILYYLTKFFYPMNLGIAQNWVVRTVDLRNFWLPLIGECLLLMTAITYIIKNKNKVFTFFFLWFLIGLLPHLQIIPLNMTVAERWLYFPMIGLLGMIGAALSKIGDYRLDPLLRGDDKQTSFPRRRESRLLISLGIVIILLFSFRTFIRTLDWRNGLVLFSHDVKKNSSFDLQNNMGVELFRAGRFDQAKKYFEISTQLAPYWWVNWNNLGAVFEREKNYQKAADYYQKSINNGQYYLAYENLAKTLVLYEKDQKKTEEFLQRALKLFPENKNLLMINKYFQEKNNK
ncbi:glycosyltransferase family 39 protein [Candidatus Roizmanbacteria bacterium]|nr:glycosyltransferase family 39 protein [Candidatus Roizmanbacteria bacterium]